MNTDFTIATRLDEEYTKTLDAVALAREGTEEAKWQLQKLNELHKQRMAEQKVSDESYLQMEELSLKKEELELKKKQAKEAKTDRYIKYGLEGAAILLPIGASWYWMSKGLTFEQTGSFTSKVQQWVSGHTRLFKK